MFLNYNKYYFNTKNKLTNYQFKRLTNVLPNTKTLKAIN